MTACLNKINGDVTHPDSVKQPGNMSEIRGFSLLEIMVVLSIIAFSSGLLVWQIGQSKKSLNFEEIISALEKTAHGLRHHSITSGNIATLDIAERNSGWRINGEEKERFQSDTEISAYAVSKSGNQKLRNIVFFPDGSSSGALIRIKSGKQNATIYLDPLTGKIQRKN